jgi:hypothetical protein
MAVGAHVADRAALDRVVIGPQRPYVAGGLAMDGGASVQVASQRDAIAADQAVAR